MLEYIKKEANMTQTENGAVTYESTGSDCLNLFATAGALRHACREEIIARFVRAYTENPDIAMKILIFCKRYQRRTGRTKCIPYNFCLVG